MDRDVLIPIFVNPLVAFFADPDWKAMQQDAPTVEAALEYLCDPNVDSSLDAIIARYGKRKDEPRGLSRHPTNLRYLKNLFGRFEMPSRHTCLAITWAQSHFAGWSPR